MGIDIYARWPDQTEEERQAQYTGFQVDKGHIGYLREAYHGEPYATQVLVPEAFAEDGSVGDLGVAISAATLRERLPAAVTAAVERERKVYGEHNADETCPPAQSLRDFVALIERLEAEGKNPHVYASW